MTTAQVFSAPELDFEEYSVDYLNEVFAPLNFEERIRRLYDFFEEKDILMTSSFGASAAFLLRLISEHRPTQKIYFLDTTYHFPETLAYKEQLSELFRLNVVDILPDSTQNALTREEEWWKEHPKMCCSINKVVPLEPVKAAHKVWISGLMAYQTEFRAHLRIFEQQGDIIKFHPLIDLSEGDFLYWSSWYKLPKHPLESQGYGSIGCTHCTQKGQGREGRWAGTGKTECGLHPGFFVNKQKP